MANEYDLTTAFEEIENELIASMMRNMARHRAEETEEGIQWSMWQAEQLRALEKYRRNNQKQYSREFTRLNKQIEELIRQSRKTGGMKQEIRILQAIRKGFKIQEQNQAPAHRAISAAFFRLNERKLNALVEATTHDMQKAETAVLRMANDKYRKIIYNAQVYANTGAGTYEKAVDMATKDFLSAGLNCIEYANGARHRISDYAEMAIRTASKRAYLQGEGEKRKEWGISTVIINKRSGACPLCAPFVGKVMIDDVWSGGGRNDGKYPLLSRAIAAGLYHPRCKDSHTTYFPGISTADDVWTDEELRKVGADYLTEQKQKHAERQAERFGRLAKHSLDPENKRMYGARAEQWKNGFVKGDKSGFKQTDDERSAIVKMAGVDVERYKGQHSFSDGSGKTSKPLNAVIYKLQDGTKFIFPESYNPSHQSMTPEKAIELWNRVPESVRKQSQKTIEFVDYYNPKDSYWRRAYKNFTHSYATGGDSITFYRWDHSHNDGYVIRTYCHETGHFIDRNMQNSSGIWYSDDTEWTQAMKNDIIKTKKKSVTKYGENSNHEDFAESCAEYIKDISEFKKAFPHRAELLQKIFTGGG